MKFRACQIAVNAILLIGLAIGLASYLSKNPPITYVNQTTIARTINNRLPPAETTFAPAKIDRNPAPGVCLPVIVKFCQQHKVPYNYTVFPNYIGHFGQPEAQMVSTQLPLDLPHCPEGERSSNLSLTGCVCDCLLHVHSDSPRAMISRKLIFLRRWSMSNATSLFHCSYVPCLCLNAVSPDQR